MAKLAVCEDVAAVEKSNRAWPILATLKRQAAKVDELPAEAVDMLKNPSPENVGRWRKTLDKIDDVFLGLCFGLEAGWWTLDNLRQKFGSSSEPLVSAYEVYNGQGCRF